jgi:phosphatidylglycerophosphatase C
MAIAIFDLDGTITHRDTLFPLVLRHLARRPWRLLRLLGVLPALLRFAFDQDRGALKQSLLRMTLRGTPRAEIDELAREFVRDKIAHDCFRDALATIRRHRDAGHYLVLMSASVDFYVPEFGRQLDFDQVISTEVRWQDERLDGTLISANRRGEEKARCVRALLAGTGRRKLRLRQQCIRSAAPATGRTRPAGEWPCRRPARGRRTGSELCRLDVTRAGA